MTEAMSRDEVGELFLYFFCDAHRTTKRASQTHLREHFVVYCWHIQPDYCRSCSYLEFGHEAVKEIEIENRDKMVETDSGI